MIISSSVLQRFVTFNESGEELADILRFSSSEVDRISHLRAPLHGLIVGKIISTEPHPNADRLQLCSVDCGEMGMRQIVCGAPNARPNIYVVVAPSGTLIQPTSGPAITITTTVIRGTTSEGMLCAYSEIGLPFKGIGIIELQQSLLGSSAAQALGISAYSLSIEVTPNRPDLLSYQGIAREITAVCQTPLREVEHSRVPTTRVKALTEAVRFLDVTIKNITITDSPEWLQRELWESGCTSVNTIVDLTNLVMLETGQPLHAYDAGTLVGSLSLRRAMIGEQMTCLDGKTRNLEPEDLVVCDESKKTVSLAGIMGSEATKVTSSTTSITVESGCFKGSDVRTTSRRLGLRSEASLRSEKGLAPYYAEIGMLRLVWRVKQLFPDAVVEVIHDHYQGNTAITHIETSCSAINTLLGSSFTIDECKKTLEALGCVVTTHEDQLSVQPPEWRADLLLSVDLAEEIIRIRGYDELPATFPSGKITPPNQHTRYSTIFALCSRFANSGYQQTIHLSLTSAKALERTEIPLELCQRVLLPLSNEAEYLIPSHSIPLLENLTSTNRLVKELQLFECGTVFEASNRELLRFSTISVGPDIEIQYRKQLAALEDVLGVVSTQSTIVCPAYFDSNRAISLSFNNVHVGWVGAFNPDVLQAWGCLSDPIFSEVDLEPILQAPRKTRRFDVTALTSFTRDVTLHQPAEAGKVIEHVRNSLSELSLVTIELLGQYRMGDATTITLRLKFTGDQAAVDTALAILTT